MATFDCSLGRLPSDSIDSARERWIGVLVFILSPGDSFCEFFADFREVLDKRGDSLPLSSFVYSDPNLIGCIQECFEQLPVKVLNQKKGHLHRPTPVRYNPVRSTSDQPLQPRDECLPENSG